MFFHGNAEDIGLAYELLNHLRVTLQVHILGVEYPGYGIYEGQCSEERVYDDALNVFTFLQSTGIDPSDIIVFGRSIGSGPACYLAAHTRPAAMLLMSAYTSIRDAVKYIVGTYAQYLVKERFRNIDNIARVSCPVFLLHGQKDTMIPYEHSQDLRDKCAGPCSMVLPANMDHNEFDFFEDLSLPFSAFLMQHGISVLPTHISRAYLNFPAYLFKPPGENELRREIN
jgi:abhydrolase domain-containing protein 17